MESNSIKKTVSEPIREKMSRGMQKFWDDQKRGRVLLKRLEEENTFLKSEVSRLKRRLRKNRAES